MDGRHRGTGNGPRRQNPAYRPTHPRFSGSCRALRWAGEAPGEPQRAHAAAASLTPGTQFCADAHPRLFHVHQLDPSLQDVVNSTVDLLVPGCMDVCFVSWLLVVKALQKAVRCYGTLVGGDRDCTAAERAKRSAAQLTGKVPRVGTPASDATNALRQVLNREMCGNRVTPRRRQPRATRRSP